MVYNWRARDIAQAGGSAQETEIRRTITDYFEAFHRSDSSRFADQWAYPASVWSHGEWWQIPDRETCVSANAAYEQEARAQGMAGGRILEMQVSPLGQTSALVSGAFSRLREDGSLIGTVEASYVVIRTGRGWKVAVCVMKD